LLFLLLLSSLVFFYHCSWIKVKDNEEARLNISSAVGCEITLRSFVLVGAGLSNFPWST
jgi:hypothetical protein